MKVENGLTAPYNWGQRCTWKQDGPGVHQIRLHSTEGANRTKPREHRQYKTSRSSLEIACSCGEHISWIQPGEDCWTPFNEHLRSLYDNH